MTRIDETLMIARLAPSPSSPAPSARRHAAWGLTARRGRANSGGRAAIPSHDDSGIELTRLSDNVRKVECWFSQI
jgi:hypothetical protein